MDIEKINSALAEAVETLVSDPQTSELRRGRNVELRLPVYVRDKRSGELKQAYSRYAGYEVQDEDGSRSRLYSLRNKKGDSYLFEVDGRGNYSLTKVNNGSRVTARGTMLDRPGPELIQR